MTTVGELVSASIHSTAVAYAFELLSCLDVSGWQRIADASDRHVAGRLSREAWQAVCEISLNNAYQRFVEEGSFGAYEHRRDRVDAL